MYYDEFRGGFDNGFPVEDADFEVKSEQLRGTAEAAYRYSGGKGSLEARVSHDRVFRRFFSNFPSAFDSERAVVDVFNKYVFGEQWYTIAGVNIIDDRTDFDGEQTASAVDPYANLVFVSGAGLNVNLGGRLNNHSEYGSNAIYNLNPSLRVPLGKGYAKLFGSYATSFIAPNLSQLFGPFRSQPKLGTGDQRHP